MGIAKKKVLQEMSSKTWLTQAQEIFMFLLDYIARQLTEKRQACHIFPPLRLRLSYANQPLALASHYRHESGVDFLI